MARQLRVSAAPVPAVLDDGREYRVSPLSDRDWDELQEWARGQIIRAARASLSDDMSQEERREVLGAAAHSAARMTLLDKDINEMFASPVGLARMLWQSLRREHPKLSLEWARDAVLEGDNGERLLTAFKTANGNIVSDDNSEEGGGADEGNPPSAAGGAA